MQVRHLMREMAQIVRETFPRDITVVELVRCAIGEAMVGRFLSEGPGASGTAPEVPATKTTALRVNCAQ